MMGKNSEILEPKRMNKIKIARFISKAGSTSKAEISNKLNLSMPTTLQNVRELMEAGLVAEEGAYESTGGRKAKMLSIAREAAYVTGVDITNNHISFVMVNARKEIVSSERVREPFRNTSDYYDELGKRILAFIGRAGIRRETIVGVGLSLPGIVDREQKMLLRSHTLQVQNVSFRGFGEFIGFECEVENDANSAAHAELVGESRDAIYLSLSNTVGGAICLQDHLYKGDNFKSAEFGHMIMERNGRPCYCGKRGCIDAYCAAKLLQRWGDGSLETFFDRVRNQDERVMSAWEEYLDVLAIAVTNLRMAFDCEIILGGYVGGYLEEFLPALARKVQLYNNFDVDASYLKTGRYKLEAAAYGVTLGFIESFIDEVA